MVNRYLNLGNLGIEYSPAFCRKVFGEILFAPTLEVCTVGVLQTALEVAGGCRDTRKRLHFAHEVTNPAKVVNMNVPYRA